jgi:hypothetical protein
LRGTYAGAVIYERGAIGILCARIFTDADFTKKQGQFLPERAAIKWARRAINKKNFYNITDCILRKKYRFGKKDKKN